MNAGNRNYDTDRASAVALSYSGKGAPRVTAKGHGELAKRIIDLAQTHNIPLSQDKELTALLAQIPLGQEIPEELYIAVAEVIAFAYRLSGQLPPMTDQSEDRTPKSNAGEDGDGS